LSHGPLLYALVTTSTLEGLKIVARTYRGKVHAARK
jgi:hypothetical protein